MSSKNEAEKVRYKNSTYTKIYDYDTPSANSEGTVETSTLLENTESNSGTDRPNWKALIAVGASAGNPVHANKVTFTLEPFYAKALVTRRRLNGNPPGRIVYRTELTEHTRRYYTSLAIPAVGVHIPAAKTQATANFVKKAQKRLTPTQLGVFFGELNETIRMIRRPATGIRKGIERYLVKVNKDLRRNKHLKVPKRNAIVAETWLEFAFGWTPLILDAEGAAEAAGKVATGMHLKIKDFAVSETSVNEAGGSLGVSPAGEFRFDITRKTSTRSDVYGRFKPEFANNVPFPDAFGLRPNDILPTIWELVPWSFAIDYFTGVGDYISSKCFPTTSLQWYCRSTHTQVVRSTSNCRIVGDAKTNSTNLTIETTFAQGKSSCNVETFDRETASMIDLVSPVRFGLPEHRKAYANLVALARAKTIH